MLILNAVMFYADADQEQVYDAQSAGRRRAFPTPKNRLNICLCRTAWGGGGPSNDCSELRVIGWRCAKAVVRYLPSFDVSLDGWVSHGFHVPVWGGRHAYASAGLEVVVTQ